MSTKPNIAKIIKEQRNMKGLSLNQLAQISGVSLSHLGRIEQGYRKPSTRTLQKIAKPLGFDLYELFVMTGQLSPGSSLTSEEEREKLRAELNELTKRVAADTKRIQQIMNRLILSK
jgi:transcriptional regulator with XRE-family HTH domain